MITLLPPRQRRLTLARPFKTNSIKLSPRSARYWLSHKSEDTLRPGGTLDISRWWNHRKHVDKFTAPRMGRRTEFTIDTSRHTQRRSESGIPYILPEMSFCDDALPDWRCIFSLLLSVRG